MVKRNAFKALGPLSIVCQIFKRDNRPHSKSNIDNSSCEK